MIKSAFNPYNNRFNTREEWSKFLKPSINYWEDKGILKVTPSSILEDLDLFLDLGEGGKLYNFQQTNGKLFAFPEDDIGSPIEIGDDQIYWFRINDFLECLANENNFFYADVKLSETDYLVGDVSIGNKKIGWICSFSTEGFQKYKTKPYFEEINEKYDFILLSDCFGNTPNVKDNKLGYVKLPFNFHNFRIDPRNFIKRTTFADPDKVRGFLKNIIFFIDNETGKIYYRNKEVSIRRNCYAYRLFIALLREPLKEHNVEAIVKEKLKRSSESDLLGDGRGYKRTLKERLINTHPKQVNAISQFLPDIRNGTIRLNLPKKDIFFF